MDITHGNDIWSKLKDKCSDKMYEGTETVTVMLAGTVITYGSVKVTKYGEVII